MMTRWCAHPRHNAKRHQSSGAHCVRLTTAVSPAPFIEWLNTIDATRNGAPVWRSEVVGAFRPKAQCAALDHGSQQDASDAHPPAAQQSSPSVQAGFCAWHAGLGIRSSTLRGSRYGNT